MAPGEDLDAASGLMSTRSRLNVLSVHPLFDGCAADDLDDLANASRHLVCSAGDVIVTEGAAATSFFVLLDGDVNVERSGADEAHRLVTLRGPSYFGEAALLGEGTRSATVRAANRASLVEIEREVLVRLAEGRPGFTQVLLRLMEETFSRLRRASEQTVEQLDRALEDSRMRMSIGRFLMVMILGLTGYTVFISLVSSAKSVAVKSEFITVPMLFTSVLVMVVFMRVSGFPARFFGLTLDGGRRAALEGALAALPLMAAAVAVKAWLVRGTAAPIFDLFPGGGVVGTIDPLLIVAYVVFVPVQELICRGVLQSTLQVFLVSRFRAIEANVAANAVFLIAHLYISYTLSVIAFLSGLYWGWLYGRQRTLVGVVVCHILVGLFAFEVVGLPGIE